MIHEDDDGRDEDAEDEARDDFADQGDEAAEGGYVVLVGAAPREVDHLAEDYLGEEDGISAGAGGRVEGVIGCDCLQLEG